jgi:hypothetical protein
LIAVVDAVLDAVLVETRRPLLKFVAAHTAKRSL